jgi:hypothetical protein
MDKIKPTLFTSLSPALLNLYDISSATVVIIDVLRATSTLQQRYINGAKAVIPVDSVSRCIEIGKQIHGITAGERDGKVAEGLIHGNSPFEYPRDLSKERHWCLLQRMEQDFCKWRWTKAQRKLSQVLFLIFQQYAIILLKRNKM